MCSAVRPDVVLMDVRMPARDGIDATRDIVAAGLPSKVLILTTFDLDDYIYAGLRAGASGFLLKDTQPASLVAAIRTITAGDVRPPAPGWHAVRAGPATLVPVHPVAGQESPMWPKTPVAVVPSLLVALAAKSPACTVGPRTTCGSATGSPSSTRCPRGPCR